MSVNFGKSDSSLLYPDWNFSSGVEPPPLELVLFSVETVCTRVLDHGWPCLQVSKMSAVSCNQSLLLKFGLVVI